RPRGWPSASAAPARAAWPAPFRRGERRHGAANAGCRLREPERRPENAGREAVRRSAGDERGGDSRRPVRLFRHPPSLPAPSVASSTPSSLPVRRTLLAPSSLPAPPALLDRLLTPLPPSLPS